jgi:hypothetical protein
MVMTVAKKIRTRLIPPTRIGARRGDPGARPAFRNARGPPEADDA